MFHAGLANYFKVDVRTIDAETLEQGDLDSLKDLDGILVPGGFGQRGVEGKMCAIRYARENKIPFFGICLGMQLAVIEFMRHVLHFEDANSTEFNPETKTSIISLMEEQNKHYEKGASMRLGAVPCDLKDGSLLQKIYGCSQVYERHRHRYELNDRYKDLLEKSDLKIVGKYAQSNLAEAVELEGHPWFVAVQYHPEFKSKPYEPHPIFTAFIKACLK